MVTKKKSYREAFLALLNKIDSLTSEEHKEEVRKQGYDEYAYIVGEIKSAAEWEQYEVTQDINVIKF